MPAIARYAKTPKGRVEIDARQRNLPGKLRTMLILVDPSKSAEELRAQGARIGVAPDFLETLSTAGYIAPLGAAPSAVLEAAADRTEARGARDAVAAPSGETASAEGT